MNGVKSSSGLIWNPKPTTGYATITGDDPMHLKVTDVGVYPGNPLPYGGGYPCGSLVYNGVWYYGTYCLLDSDGDPSKGLNWDILGPFVGFRYSTDYGKTWQDTSHTPAAPLFGEPTKPGGVVKMGSPHFVDFGKNMQYSPDGYAYLVGQGATDPDPKPRPANLSWITGDQIYMARVKPSIQNMNDRAKYEFFDGYDASGHPIWTHDFSRIKPLVDWNNNCGCFSMTYVAALKRYLMCIILLTRHKYVEARPYLQAATGGEGNARLYAHALLSKVYAAQGDIPSVIKELETGLPTDDDGSLHFQLYRLYENAGDHEKAKVALQQSQALRKQMEDRARHGVEVNN